MKTRGGANRCLPLLILLVLMDKWVAAVEEEEDFLDQLPPPPPPLPPPISPGPGNDGGGGSSSLWLDGPGYGEGKCDLFRAEGGLVAVPVIDAAATVSVT